MKTLRKTIAVLLSIVMLLTLAPLGAFAEGEETISLWETKTVTLNNSGETVLYKFVPEETGNYVFESRSPDYATYVSLKNSDNSTLVASSNGGLGYNFRLVYEFQAGETYFFMTGFAVGGVTGSYPVKLYPEHNHIDADDNDICDICDWAVPWTTLTLDEYGSASSVAAITYKGGKVWFKFAPETTSIYDFELSTSRTVECRIYASYNENQIYEDYNNNLTITRQFEAGKSYFFEVGFHNYTDIGNFPVSLVLAHECIDTNNDYHCDRCNKVIPHTCVDADDDNYCELCSKEMVHICIDEDENYICDSCLLPIAHTCIDENEDYLCDCCSNPYGHYCEYNYECDPPVCQICGVSMADPLSLNASKIIDYTDKEEGVFNTFTPEKSGTYIFFGKSVDNNTTAVLYNSSFNDIAVDFSENSDFYFEAELEAGMTYYLMSGKMGYEYNSPLYTVTLRCGHSSTTAYEAEDATCTSAGHTAYEVCNICEERIGYEEIAIADHSFTSYTPNNNATCSQNGTETAYCDFGCGETHERDIPDSKLPHSFVDGVCTECEAEDPDYEPTVDPEEPTTEPDEPTIDPEEPTTEPDEPTIDPEEPTTEPVEPTTDPVEPDDDNGNSNPLQWLFDFIKLIIELLEIIYNAPFMNK